MNRLTAFFFLLFLPLLSIDAQARLLPGMSLNDESMILNMGGRISSLPTPSSTISSPRPLMEIRRSSSSIFEMTFDVIGWISGGAPDPKAAETIEQQQAKRKSDQNDETAKPCDKLIIPSSNLILPPTPPAPRAMLLRPIPASPPIQSLVHPPPIMPSPITPHATPLPANLFSPPIAAVPPVQNSVHPPPIMPSPENNDQMIDGIRSTTSSGNSVISMMTHPQNDHLQVC